MSQYLGLIHCRNIIILSEVVEKKEDKIINKKMEALVSTLASQYALSPGGVRNLIKKTIDTEQVIQSCCLLCTYDNSQVALKLAPVWRSIFSLQVTLLGIESRV